MNARILVAALAAGIALTACVVNKDEAPAAPAVDLAAEEQAIRARSAEWLAAVQAKDVAATITVFAPDAITLFDGQIRRGVGEIQAGMEKGQAENPDGQVTWTTTGVTVAASGDLAWETGDTTDDPDGAGEKPASAGSFSTVWKKIDGQWRVIADAGTSIKPTVEGEAPAN